jgi:hypothetical protein
MKLLCKETVDECIHSVMFSRWVVTFVDILDIASNKLSLHCDVLDENNLGKATQGARKDVITIFENIFKNN